jgi:hypothetical protein
MGAGGAVVGGAVAGADTVVGGGEAVGARSVAVAADDAEVRPVTCAVVGSCAVVEGAETGGGGAVVVVVVVTGRLELEELAWPGRAWAKKAERTLPEPRPAEAVWPR